MALSEGSSPNAGDAVGDGHARQTTAISEGRIPNAGYTIGYRIVTASPGSKLNQCGFIFVE
jgi:hypothetical protein